MPEPERSGPSAVRLSPDLRWLAVGLVLLLSGPVVLWPIATWTSRVIGQNQGTATIVAGWVTFVVGWLLIGASLRPQGNARRGAFVALLIYLGGGLLWSGAYAWMDENPSGFDPVGFVVAAVVWPVHVSFIFDWFGLTFN